MDEMEANERGKSMMEKGENMFTKEVIKLAKPCYEAIKKISKGKWEWEPEFGQWVLNKDDPQPRILMDTRINADNYIPLFHWEKIEEILEGMGYKTELDESSTLHKEFIIWDERQNVSWGVDSLVHGKVVKRYKNWKGKAETRQLAVMQAVMELGKGGVNVNKKLVQGILQSEYNGR